MIFICALCKGVYDGVEAMRKHYTNHVEKNGTGRFACEICGRCFHLKSNRDRHLRIIHKNKERPAIYKFFVSKNRTLKYVERRVSEASKFKVTTENLKISTASKSKKTTETLKVSTASKSKKTTETLKVSTASKSKKTTETLKISTASKSKMTTKNLQTSTASYELPAFDKNGVKRVYSNRCYKKRVQFQIPDFVRVSGNSSSTDPIPENTLDSKPESWNEKVKHLDEGNTHRNKSCVPQENEAYKINCDMNLEHEIDCHEGSSSQNVDLILPLKNEDATAIPAQSQSHCSRNRKRNPEPAHCLRPKRKKKKCRDGHSSNLNVFGNVNMTSEPNFQKNKTVDLNCLRCDKLFLDLSSLNAHVAKMLPMCLMKAGKNDSEFQPMFCNFFALILYPCFFFFCHSYEKDSKIWGI